MKATGVHSLFMWYQFFWLSIYIYKTWKHNRPYVVEVYNKKNNDNERERVYTKLIE